MLRRTDRVVAPEKRALNAAGQPEPARRAGPAGPAARLSAGWRGRPASPRCRRGGLPGAGTGARVGGAAAGGRGQRHRGTLGRLLAAALHVLRRAAEVAGGGRARRGAGQAAGAAAVGRRAPPWARTMTPERSDASFRSPLQVAKAGVASSTTPSAVARSSVRRMGSLSSGAGPARHLPVSGHDRIRTARGFFASPLRSGPRQPNTAETGRFPVPATTSALMSPWGRAPKWEITSAAAAEPQRPHSGSARPWV